MQTLPTYRCSRHIRHVKRSISFDESSLKMCSERLLASTSEAVSASEISSKLRWKNHQIFWFVACPLFGGFIVIYLLQITPKFNQYGILKSYSTSHKDSAEVVHQPRTILLWNSFFGDTRWYLPDDTLGPDYFKDQRCPVVNCELTNNRDFLPAVEMYDAVVFHVAEPFPLLHPVPRRRSPMQQYVFALMEPPGETKHVLGDEGGFYNLTMTYRLDSDITWPYMYFEDIESGALVAPALSPPWRKPPSCYSDKQLDSLLLGKKKFAAWFVSHCETLSKREELTKSLQEFVDVDVYGTCGPFKCAHCSKKCHLLLDTDYKFYFAFENALCLDYVTEKLFNALKRYIVPVVFGGADYTRIAPPNSYINAENFKTSKELADYLIYLDKNPKEYARYFWWRQYYRLTNRSPFCDLCAKLNAPAQATKVQFYSDIQHWWLGNTCYFEPKIMF